MRFTITFLVAALLSFSVMAAPAATPAELEARISAKLVDTFGDDAKTIHVAAVDGKVTLVGDVVERSTQELAEEVASFFPEVKQVDNQLKASKDRTLLDGQLKDETADANLEAQVKSSLAAEIGAHAKDIEVEAADGFVSVRGTVPDEARLKLAREAAAKPHGLRKLVDLLRVAN